MHIRIIILIIILSMGKLSHAQLYFNERNAHHAYASVLSNVAPKDGKYYCAGYAMDSINPTLILGIKYAIYNSLGQKERDTILQLPDRNIFTDLNNMVAAPDGGWVLAGTAYETTGSGIIRLLLLKIDSLGREAWHREYDKPFCTSASKWFGLFDYKPIEHNQHLLLGRIKCATNAGWVLLKLDSNLDVIWQKQYNHAVYDNIGWKILPEADGYVIAGGQDNTNTNQKNFVAQAKLWKLDTAGNVLWTYESTPSKLTNWARDVVRTADGGYVYCGQGDGKEVPDANPQSAEMEWKGWVEKIDVNRQVVWNKSTSTLYTNMDYNEWRVLRILPSGDLMLAGGISGGMQQPDTLDRLYGGLMKLSDDGNIKWARKYVAPNSDTGFIYRVYDMKTVADGGYIVCGEATDILFPQTPPTQQGWLLKVDSNGCSGPGDPQCWPVGIHETEAPQVKYRVYPNPVGDVLYISGTATQENKVSVTVYDALGRQVSEYALPASGKGNINVSNWAPGLYLYRISAGSRLLQQGRVVKL